MESPGALGGLGVLVTRPAHQAEDLCRLIEAAGGRAWRFPALEIRPATSPEQAQALLVQPWDWLVFVSANAVALALELSGGLLAGPRIAAVGQATADALAAAGHPVDLVPGGQFDSEALLASEVMHRVAGQRILIVRGEGGRPLLGETLQGRGATLAYAEVYRRGRPLVDVAPLLARWERDVGAVVATSGEVLDNLVEMLGAAGRERLLDTPLVVVSPRMAEQARQIGFGTIETAERAQDAAIVAALCGLCGYSPFPLEKM
jgi:uroporphyrinogen-III synthase